MEKFKLRTMLDSDTRSISSLVAQLGYPSSADEMLARFYSVSNETNQKIILAEFESSGAVIGMLHVSVHFSLTSNASAQIASLIVDEAFRGLGVGELLMSEAEVWARARGLTQMRLTSNIKRTQAHRFYKSLGFESAKCDIDEVNFLSREAQVLLNNR